MQFRPLHDRVVVKRGSANLPSFIALQLVRFWPLAPDTQPDNTQRSGVHRTRR